MKIALFPTEFYEEEETNFFTKSVVSNNCKRETCFILCNSMVFWNKRYQDLSDHQEEEKYLSVR